MPRIHCQYLGHVQLVKKLRPAIQSSTLAHRPSSENRDGDTFTVLDITIGVPAILKELSTVALASQELPARLALVKLPGTDVRLEVPT